MFDVFEAGRLLRLGATGDLHRMLDAMEPAQTDEDRFHIAHWRAAALGRERRFDEALTCLRQHRFEFPCQTISHDEAARILEHVGRRDEAISELKSAPFIEEADRFPLFVKEAQFLLVYLLVKSGSPVSEIDLAGFPADYRSVLPSSKHCYSDHLSIEDVKTLIDDANGVSATAV